MNQAKKSPPRIFAVLAGMIVLSLAALMIGRWQGSQQNTGVALKLVESEAQTSRSPKNSGVMVLNELPQFTLVDQVGRDFGSSQLDGKVWVANFIFTRCRTMCPVLTQHMRTLQRELSEQNLSDVHLISFSVDPMNDTPEVLANYASQQKLNLSNWSLITGKRDLIYQLVKSGFKLAVAEDPSNVDMPIIHTNMFALVDRDQAVRGFYDLSSEGGRKKFVRDIQRVLSEQRLAQAAGHSTGAASGL